MIETLTVGVDEAGRGPLCGPVIAAAVILSSDHGLTGLADSKKLSARERERLFADIQNQSLCWAVGRAEVYEIDQLNILQASLLAMRRAVLGLAIDALSAPVQVLVDGNRCPDLPYPCKAIVKGDSLVSVISAASILAKVTRDREMLMLDEQYPGYGIASHKGYPTRAHREAIKKMGATVIHRKSFRPVREALAEND